MAFGGEVQDWLVLCGDELVNLNGFVAIGRRAVEPSSLSAQVPTMLTKVALGCEISTKRTHTRLR